MGDIRCGLIIARDALNYLSGIEIIEDKVMAQKKDKEKYGRACAADCDFEVFNTDMGWAASVSIDNYYYETDTYKDKQDAIDEQRGCLLAIKEQIEKYLEKLD